MEKLEKMDGKLFEVFVRNQLSDLSQISGAEKIPTAAQGNGTYTDCNFTSTMGQGSTIAQILAHNSNYCDDCSLSSLPNGANMLVPHRPDLFIIDYNNGLFNQWIV